MRIVSFNPLTQEQVAEVHEWLRLNNVNVSRSLRLDRLLKPNYPEAFHRHRYSKAQKLTIKIANWENFNFLFQQNYNIALERRFIGMLAKGKDGAAESLLHEFIQLQRRQRFVMETAVAIQMSEILDELLSMVIPEISEGNEEDQNRNGKTMRLISVPSYLWLALREDLPWEPRDDDEHLAHDTLKQSLRTVRTCKRNIRLMEIFNNR